MFRLVWAFLAKPWILWGNGNYHNKRLLLRMTLTDKLAYSREGGFLGCLNRKIAVPFGTYGDPENMSQMVRSLGPTLNSHDDIVTEFFETLSDWEQILQAENIELLEDAA